jgi:hypothetical protein
VAAIGKIPPALHALVLQLAGEGKSSEAIAEILWRDHKCETSSRAVRRLIAADRNERADVAKSVVREELRRHLIPAVTRIVNVAVRARKLEDDARDAGEVALALKAQDRQLKASNLLLHYAGLNQPDVPDAKKPGDVDARQALLDKIRNLIATPKPPTPEPDPIH